MDIDKISIPQNKVLIKLHQKYSMLKGNKAEWTMPNGNKLLIDNSFNPVQYCPRFGTLVKNPDTMYYKKGDNESLGWRTKIETKEGDTVYFDYLACIMSLTQLLDPLNKAVQGQYINDGDDLYLFLRYDALLFAKRGNEIIGLNGHILMKPIYDEVQSNLILPVNIKKKEKLLRAIVVAIGSPNKEYLDGGIDSVDINIGDTVIIKKFRLRLDATLMSNLTDKEVFFLQRKNILGKIK